MFSRIWLTGFLLLLASPSQSLARTWNVYEDGSGDAPFIQAAIDSAASGDTILVWQGTYEENVVIEGKSLVIRAPEGPENTELRETGSAAVMNMNGSETHELLIDGFAFMGATKDGIALWLTYMQWFEIRNCHIQEFTAVSVLHGGGLIADCLFSSNSTSAGDPDDSRGGVFSLTTPQPVEIIRCFFIENSAVGGRGGAVRHHGGASGELRVRDCLFYANEAVEGGAIYSNDNLTEFSGNTVVENVAEDGAVVVGSPDAGVVRIRNNVFANNECYGLYGTGIPGSGSMRCNDWWNNSGEGGGPHGHGSDWSGIFPGIEWETQFFLDPLFCDPGNGDFTVAGSSICLPENQPPEADCGLIGAFGLGTGCPSPTLKTTWGRIKARYRE